MSSMSSISLLSPLFRGKSAFLQSPWPICMFYFSNPLSSPSSAVDDCAVFGNNDNDETRFTGNYNYSTTTEPPATATTPSNGDDENAGHANETDRIRLASFVPSWSGGAPLTELVASRHGKLALALLSRPNYHFLHDWVYVCNWYFSQFPPSRTH